MRGEGVEGRARPAVHHVAAGEGQHLLRHHPVLAADLDRGLQARASLLDEGFGAGGELVGLLGRHPDLAHRQPLALAEPAGRRHHVPHHAVRRGPPHAGAGGPLVADRPPACTKIDCARRPGGGQSARFERDVDRPIGLRPLRGEEVEDPLRLSASLGCRPARHVRLPRLCASRERCADRTARRNSATRGDERAIRRSPRPVGPTPPGPGPGATATVPGSRSVAASRAENRLRASRPP